MPDLLPTEQTQTMQDNIESQSQYQDGQFPYCESIDCPQEQEPQRPQIAEASVAVGSEARHPSYESPLCRGWSVSPITKRMSPQMEAWLEKEMAEFMGMGDRNLGDTDGDCVVPMPHVVAAAPTSALDQPRNPHSAAAAADAAAASSSVASDGNHGNVNPPETQVLTTRGFLDRIVEQLEQYDGWKVPIKLQPQGVNPNGMCLCQVEVMGDPFLCEFHLKGLRPIAGDNKSLATTPRTPKAHSASRSAAVGHSRSPRRAISFRRGVSTDSVESAQGVHSSPGGVAICHDRARRSTTIGR